MDLPKVIADNYPLYEDAVFRKDLNIPKAVQTEVFQDLAHDLQSYLIDMFF